MAWTKILGVAAAALLAVGPAARAQDYDCFQGLVPEQFTRDARSPTDVGMFFAGSDADAGAARFLTLIDTGGAETATVVMRVAVAGTNPEGPAPTLFCFSAFDLADWDGMVAAFRIVSGAGQGANGRPLFDIRPEGGNPLPDGTYFFGLEVALVEDGKIVPDAFDGNNVLVSPRGQFVGARFLARFTSAELNDDGTLDVAFTGVNAGSAPTGNLSLTWISGDEVQTVASADGLGAGESRLFEQAFENPGENVRFRVVRIDPEQVLYDEVTNLPVDAGGPGGDDDGDDGDDGDGDEDDGGNDPPTEGVDFDVVQVGLHNEGEGFYDIVVRVRNIGTADAQSTPAVTLSLPNVNLVDQDQIYVVVGEDGGPLGAGETSAEVRFSLNLGTDPDARPRILSGQVTVAGVAEDQDPSNNSEGFELEVPEAGAPEEPEPPVIALVEYAVRDEPPTEYGEPGTLRIGYALANQGAAGTRYEIDFHGDNEGESLVAKLEAQGATLDQGQAESSGQPLPANATFAQGSLRFVVPEQAWEQTYEGVLVVRAYYQNAAGEEVMVDPPSRFEVAAKLPPYPKPDLKVQVLINGAQNPEAFTPQVGSNLQFTVRAVNVGRVPVDGEIGVKLIGKLLGESVLEATHEGGIGLGETVEEETEPRAVDCDEVARIEGAQDRTIKGATWLEVENPQGADVRPVDNARKVALGVPANDCGEEPEGPTPCTDGDPATLCPRCNDGDPETPCPDGEIDRDRGHDGPIRCRIDPDLCEPCPDNRDLNCPRRQLE